MLLDRFAAAFEDGDMAALAALLRADVTLEMPPLATWFSGRETVLRYLASDLCATAGMTRLVPAAANVWQVPQFFVKRTRPRAMSGLEVPHPVITRTAASSAASGAKRRMGLGRFCIPLKRAGVYMSGHL